MEKETIELVKKMIEDGNLTQEIAEKYCPELAESEDERIRKALLELINAYLRGNENVKIHDVYAKDMRAWLEKQGEQKIDDDDKAILENWEGIVKDNKEKWQLSDWFIEATLLLVQKIKQIGLSKSIVDNNKTMLNACINVLKNVGHSHLATWLEKQGEQKPAIEMKTPEESLGIDSDTYNKIVDECIYGEQKPTDKVEPKFKVGDRVRYKGHACDGVITEINDTDYICGNAKLPISTQDKLELVEPKPVELTEFERYLWNITNTGEPDKDELKELKNNAQGLINIAYKQNQEWSEEDERNIKELLYLVEANYLSSEEPHDRLIKFLKFLRPRNRWKPSDEQMKAFKDIIVFGSVGKERKESLISLYRDLQELWQK